MYEPSISGSSSTTNSSTTSSSTSSSTTSSSSSSSFIDGFNKRLYKEVDSFVMSFTNFIQENGKWMSPNDIIRVQQLVEDYRTVVTRYRSLSAGGQLAALFSHKNEVRNLIILFKELLQQFRDYKTDQVMHNFITNTSSGQEPPGLPSQAQYSKVVENRKFSEQLGQQLSGMLAKFGLDGAKKASLPPKFKPPADPQNLQESAKEQVPAINTLQAQNLPKNGDFRTSRGWDSESVTSTKTSTRFKPE
ncbi:hypothetical protein FRC03_002607 [Tulasnella sp. 419]|nr:hypothetical protein FRC02_002589 [Tulasnella sp. 418]KAG8943176.1 hypothetical protein FRC03_002607 [Tulasnella sp. 419]